MRGGGGGGVCVCVCVCVCFGGSITHPTRSMNLPSPQTEQPKQTAVVEKIGTTSAKAYFALGCPRMMVVSERSAAHTHI